MPVTQGSMGNLAGDFEIQFWGVRGSIPCPGADTVRYGGNTSCVEMRVGGTRLIFDGGTGIRLLGEALRQRHSGQEICGHLFFTHTHWDHIQGFPFFAPAFTRGNHFKIYGAPTPDGANVKQRLHAQMLHPNFPVPLQIMQGNLEFYDLDIGETVTLKPGITVENRPLNHPGGALGYRVTWGERRAAFVTDSEHFLDRLDRNVLALAQDVDILIIDATYTDEEYYDPQESKIGWGHSTWQEAVKVAKTAGVKQLVLFHHDPDHSDSQLDTILEQARRRFPNTILAQEGLTLTL